MPVNDFDKTVQFGLNEGNIAIDSKIVINSYQQNISVQYIFDLSYHSINNTRNVIK